jgi:Fe-S cluster biogenesis protein NfuA
MSMDTNEAKLKQEIEQNLDEIRIAIKHHGGDVELVGFDVADGTVKVRLHGACVGCPMSEITLKDGVEAALKPKFPWIKSVLAVE